MERNLNGMGHKNSGHLRLMPSLEKKKNKKREEAERDDKVKRKNAATLLCEDYI